jgi:hypothetical protein
MIIRRVDTLNPIQARIERLRSEIAQLEARYDDSFPPSVYAVLKCLRDDLVKLIKAR